MKISVLLSVAAAMVAVTSALPTSVSKTAPAPHGYSVGLTRNKKFKHNGRAQLLKLNQRYPALRLNERHNFIRKGLDAIGGGSGSVPLIDVQNDLEYYGLVSVGTPAQKFKLDFDTGSSDIWFPSTSCTTTACKKHTRYDPRKSSTYKNDGRRWRISYGDGSSASGTLASDIVNVGGVSVRQTIGLATSESTQFGSSPEDGLFGLGFNTIESVSGVKTFLDNAIAAGSLAQPVVSVFLPAARVNGGSGGEYLFGGINSNHYSGSLTYVPVSQKGYWQVAMDDIAVNGKSLGQSSEGIVDTGTTLIIVGDAAASAIHKQIPGAVNTSDGWTVPCTLTSSTGNVSFKMGGKYFDVALADLAYEDMGDGSGNCFSGVQGGQDGLWILGDVFIKNNYCVFDQGQSRVGIAPIKY